MLELRPHHILDIVRNIGNERPIEPHEYGHLVHEITKLIIEDIDKKCILVVNNDDICKPCIKLTSDNRCTDILSQLEQPISKQEYNDNLDQRILNFLKIDANTEYTIREYLNLVLKNLNELVNICTHPKEDIEYRRQGLMEGMKKLGISNKE